MENKGFRFQIGNKSTLGKRGPVANAWKNGITRNGKNILIYKPDHPKAIHGKYVPEHRLVAEKALGKILPDKAPIHHVDCDRSNNTPSNLVICESQGYHNYLHMRQRAFQATGNVNHLKCQICKKYDSPDNLYVYYYSDGTPKFGRHKACHSENMRKLNRLKKAI